MPKAPKADITPAEFARWLKRNGFTATESLLSLNTRFYDAETDSSFAALYIGRLGKIHFRATQKYLLERRAYWIAKGSKATATTAPKPRKKRAEKQDGLFDPTRGLAAQGLSDPEPVVTQPA